MKRLSMKNRTLAIFGIGSYLLSVLTSAENLRGNPTAPTALIVIASIASPVFYCLATVRLWKIKKVVSILLPASSIIFFIFSVAFAVNLPPNGSLLVILMNVAKTISFGVFIWAVVILWRTAQFDQPQKGIEG